VSEIVHNRAVNLRLRTLLNASPSLCLVAGKPSLGILYMNDSGKRMTALSREIEEGARLSVASFFPDIVHELADQPAVGKVTNKETMLHSVKGEKIHVMACFTTYAGDSENSDSPAPEFVAIFARELTSELQVRARLHQDVERAEAAASAKSDFLATMSHEIRTPLHGIVGSADLLQGSLLDSWQADKLANIQNCSSSLLNIINDILDYSKIDARKLELEKSNFSISDCMDSCISVVSANARRKQLDLRYIICHNSVKEVVADSAKIRQIILVRCSNLCSARRVLMTIVVLKNLLGNAVKFAPNNSIIELGICACSTKNDGKGYCRVGSCHRRWMFDSCWADDLVPGVPRGTAHRPQEVGPLLLRFYVRDYGIGMNNKQQDNLFEPFNQARSVGSSKGHGLHSSDSGTGLGLSIVKRLLDFMNGGCYVRSVPGRGSCFSIWIPCEPHDSQPDPIPARIALVSETAEDLFAIAEQIEFVSGSRVEVFESVDSMVAHSLSPEYSDLYDTIFVEPCAHISCCDTADRLKQQKPLRTHVLHSARFSYRHSLFMRIST
jgi:signal transduction histidine kinase